MFQEEKRSNFAKFAPKARTIYLFNFLLGLLVLSVILFPLLILLPITVPLAVWYANEYISRFRFTLDKSDMFVRYGVFLYNYQLIPYENVQDIHVTQGLIDQVFGIWSVTVFTATVGGGAARIPLLDRNGAESLKETLFARMKEARRVTD